MSNKVVKTQTNFLLEPLDCFIFANAMWHSNLALCTTALGNPASGSIQHDIEVHAVDAYGRVIFESQIYVLLDAKTERAGSREVLSVQLVFFDLKLN